MTNAMNWSCVEVAVAIFIACIPSFNTLITHRFPRLQRLLGLPSTKDDTGASPSKTYGSSSRRTYNNLSIDNTIKLTPIIGSRRSVAEPSPSESQERIMYVGIQGKNNVTINNKSVS